MSVTEGKVPIQQDKRFDLSIVGAQGWLVVTPFLIGSITTYVCHIHKWHV